MRSKHHTKLANTIFREIALSLQKMGFEEIFGRVGSGRVVSGVTRPDPREFEHLLTRPDPIRLDPTRSDSTRSDPTRPDPTRLMRFRRKNLTRSTGEIMTREQPRSKRTNSMVLLPYPFCRCAIARNRSRRRTFFFRVAKKPDSHKGGYMPYTVTRDKITTPSVPPSEEEPQNTTGEIRVHTPTPARYVATRLPACLPASPWKYLNEIVLYTQVLLRTR